MSSPAGRREAERESGHRLFLPRCYVWRLFETQKIQIRKQGRYVSLFHGGTAKRRKDLCPPRFPYFRPELRIRSWDWCNASDLVISYAWSLLVAHRGGAPHRR